MSAISLLERLNEQGIRVSLDGDNLKVSGPVKVITPELTDELRRLKPELIETLTAKRDGTVLQRRAYEARDTRLIAECRGKAATLQAWLMTNFDEHMATEPVGLPKWISALAEFGIVERGQLRNVFHYVGCIHDSGSCPDEAPVCCTACEGSQQ